MKNWGTPAPEVTVQAWRALDRAEQRALEGQARRYGTFLGETVRLSVA